MTMDEMLEAVTREFLDQNEGSSSWLERNRKRLEALVRHKLQPLGQGRVVFLAIGLGRDSFAMLCLLLEERLIAQGTLVKPGDLSAVIFADTGYEWQHTYEVLPLAQQLCQQAGLRWLHLRKPSEEGEAGWRQWQDGWQSRRDAGQARSLAPWRQDPPATIEERAASGYYHQRGPILDDYAMRSSVISVAKQDCTSNHKIAPMRRALEDLAHETYGVETNREWGAQVRKGQRRPHLALIGYAADEHHRLENAADISYVQEAYPLVELGITKADEAPILERWHLNHVRKSGCMLCPYQPVGWYWALQEVDPDAFEKVVEYERRALERNPRMNLLPGRRLLRETVDAWRQANPDATVEQVLTKAYNRCRPKEGVRCEERLEETTRPVSPELTQLLAFAQARTLLRHYGVHIP